MCAESEPTIMKQQNRYFQLIDVACEYRDVAGLSELKQIAAPLFSREVEHRIPDLRTPLPLRSLTIFHLPGSEVVQGASQGSSQGSGGG